MSVLPLLLDGAKLSALVVGGGSVAARKARGLLAAGARVTVVAPDIAEELERMAEHHETVRLRRERFRPSHIADHVLIIAATDNHDTNRRVSELARARARLVTVVDEPSLGNCASPAVHRVGDLVVAVSAGGVPGASQRIRDRVARLLDERYADAVRELAALRRGMLSSGQRPRWREIAGRILGPEFCASVESGGFAERLAEWR